MEYSSISNYQEMKPFFTFYFLLFTLKLLLLLLFDWDDVNCRVIYFLQKAVDNRAIPENLPARTR